MIDLDAISLEAQDLITLLDAERDSWTIRKMETTNTVWRQLCDAQIAAIEDQQASILFEYELSHSLVEWGIA